MSKLLKLNLLNSSHNYIAFSNLRCLSSKSSEIVLTKRRSQFRSQKRYCSAKEVDDFLKTTKIRFLSNNQVDTEEELTRKELALLVGSLIFLGTMAIGYLLTHTLEYQEDVQYEKFKFKEEDQIGKSKDAVKQN